MLLAQPFVRVGLHREATVRCMKPRNEGAVRSSVVLVIVGVLFVLAVGLLAPLLLPAPSLEGGTRLNYAMDLERALAEERITQDEFDDSAELMRRTAGILTRRLNPQFGFGPRGARVVVVDSNHFAVEVPPFDTEEDGRKLALLRSIIESAAVLDFYMGAEVDSPLFDLAAERTRVLSWARQNHGVSLVKYNALTPEEGGAPARLRWLPHRLASYPEPDVRISMEHRLAPLVVQEERFRYRSDDLESVGVSTDSVGLPAVFVELANSRKAAFGRFTREHVGDRLAIVFDDEVLTLATINEELKGSFIMSGGARGFEFEDIHRYVNLLRIGSLAAKPELVSQEPIAKSSPHSNSQ